MTIGEEHRAWATYIYSRSCRCFCSSSGLGSQGRTPTRPSHPTREREREREGGRRELIGDVTVTAVVLFPASLHNLPVPCRHLRHKLCFSDFCESFFHPAMCLELPTASHTLQTAPHTYTLYDTTHDSGFQFNPKHNIKSEHANG